MATKDGSPSLPISQSGKSKGTPPPFFTCLYTNASSIKGDTREEKLNDLTTRITKNMPDLIGISETGFDNDLSTRTAEEYLRGQLNYYNVFVCNIGEGRGRRSDVQRGPQSRAGTYGGVAICVKNTALSSELVNFVNIPNPSYVDQVWCTVTLKSGETGLVGCIYQLVLTNDVYTSNNAAANIEIEQAFTKAKKIVKENNLKFLLIMGDFNNPNLKWGVVSDCLKISKTIQQRENDFENMLLEHDLTQWVKKPTFPSHTSLGFAIKRIANHIFDVTLLSKLTISNMYRIDNENPPKYDEITSRRNDGVISRSYDGVTLRSYVDKNYDDVDDVIDNGFLNNHNYACTLAKTWCNIANTTQKISRIIVQKILDHLKLIDVTNLNVKNYVIVGDFDSPSKTWPKKLKIDVVEFEVDSPIGNILDLLITNKGAIIKKLEQYDPLGKKKGHSVLTFVCEINQ